MNRWYQIRRLRGAVILILVGVLALLNQWNILHWHTSWPIILIVLGLLMVLERAAWSAEIRTRQEEQEYEASGGAYTPSRPLGGIAGSGPWPPSTPSSSVGSSTYVESQPRVPDEPGREGR